MLRRPKFAWQSSESSSQKRSTGESQSKGSPGQEHDRWNTGSTWNVNMSGKRTSTAMKSIERDETPTSYGRANGTRKRQRSSTREHSESSLHAQPKRKKLNSKPELEAHKRTEKSGPVPTRSPRYPSSDKGEELDDAESIPEVVSDVIPRQGRPVPSGDDTHEYVSGSPANSETGSDHEATEREPNSDSESGSTEDEAEQLRASVARPMLQSTIFEDLDDDNSFPKPASPLDKMASGGHPEDEESADDSSATRNARYAASALSSVSAPRARNHVPADSDAQGQDPGVEDTVAYSQPTERESEEDAEPTDAAQIGTSDQHNSSPNSIFDPAERSMLPSTAAPVHAAKRKKRNHDEGVSTSKKRHKRGVYSPPTSNSPEADGGLATNSERPRTIQGTFSINRPAKSKKSRSAKTQVREDQPLVDSWVKPLSLDATYKHPLFNPTPRKQAIGVQLTNLHAQSAATSSKPKPTTRPSARGRRSTKRKSSERVQDSSDDEGDVSRVRRTLRYSDRKGKSKAQPGIDYTSPPRQATRFAKRTPAEDSSEDESDTASDNDDSYRTAHSFHTGTPNSNAVHTDDALDSSDHRPVKRSKVTGKRIFVRRVGAAAVGRGKTGAFEPEEVFKLDKFRDDCCKEHAITVETFNSMMEDTSKVGRGHKWPWDRYISKRGFIDDYYNVLPSRDKKSLRRYRDRTFTNLEQKAAWTKDDDEMLMEMVKEKGPKWKAIGQEIGRTEDAVHQRYKHKLRHGDKAKTGTWTNQEIEALESAIEFCKSKASNTASGNEHEIFWTEVSDRMGGTRTAQQCSGHWRRVQKSGERQLRYAYASTATPKVDRPWKPTKKPTSGNPSVKPGKTGTEEKSRSRKSLKPVDLGGDDSDDPIEDESPMEQFASVTIPKCVKKTAQESIDTTQDTVHGLDHASDQDHPLAQEEDFSESEQGGAYQGSGILSEGIGMSQHADDDAQDGDNTQDDDDEQVDAEIGRQLRNVPKIQEETLPMQTEVALEQLPIHPQEPDFDDAWAKQEAWQKEQENKLAKEKAKRKGGKRKKTTAGPLIQPTSSVVENGTQPQPQQAVEHQDRSEIQEALERGPTVSDGTATKADQLSLTTAILEQASKHLRNSLLMARREQTIEATQGDWPDWNDSDEAISVVHQPRVPSPSEAIPESAHPGLNKDQDSRARRGAFGRANPCLACKDMQRRGAKEKPACSACQERKLDCKYPVSRRAPLPQTPGKVTNLTQAFATTQVPTSAVRSQQSQGMEIVATQSNRPSPNIDLMMQPELTQPLSQSQNLEGGPKQIPLTQDKADVDEDTGMEDRVEAEGEEAEAEESSEDEEPGSDEGETGSEGGSASDVEEDSSDSMVMATKVDYASSREKKDAKSEFTNSIKSFADKRKRASQNATWSRNTMSDSDSDEGEDEDQ